MSHRLNQEREAKLQPIRMKSTRETLEELGYEVTLIEDNTNTGYEVSGPGIKFKIYPYSGWWTGKGIGSGRGFNKLLKKLKERKYV